MANKNNSRDNIDLSVNLAGITLKNPVIAASGTFGYGREFEGLLDIKALGAICTKGLTLNPRAGNKGQRILETPSGMMNSIGLENPGIKAFIRDELPRLRELGPVIIANLSGGTEEEYIEGAILLNASSVDMVELNISCPNVKAGGMAFGMEPEAAFSVTSKVRRELKNKPLMVKLTPNAPDLNGTALACVKAGADALSLVNTFKAMAIDIYRRKPVFDNISAGLSGPCIRPIALRMVWELVDALAQTSNPVPVVGMGGIASVSDALEFLLAGAAAIQIGSATFVYPPLMNEIIDGIGSYMAEKGFGEISELRIR